MNLLLVSIDSLRLDSVARTSPSIATPRFERVAGHFCFSDRLFTTAPATRPAHLSLVSGLYPFEHGIQGQHHVQARVGTPLLFQLFAEAGYAVGAYSEAETIFSGLDLGHPVQALPSEATAGWNHLIDWVRERRSARVCLFAHYWSTHTPYGAPDGRAMGETADLLRAGKGDIVRGRYHAAVEEVFEHKLAPLIEGLDLDRWAVIIIGDHGESWTADDLYHGQTLRNSVLRVPFYLHVPGTGNPALKREVISLIDLFPTIRALFELGGEYGGFGRDVRQVTSAERCCVAEIHPIVEDGDNGNHGELLIGAREAGRQWAAFDTARKYAYDEDRQQGELTATLTEQSIDDGDGKLARRYRRGYDDLRTSSRYAGGDLRITETGDRKLLLARLRALGYLG